RYLSTFLFLLPTPPPRSTLFPYTTLFRSIPRLDGAVLEERRAVRRRRHAAAGGSRTHAGADRGTGTGGFLRRRDGAGARERNGGDRKSTRLNSSHVAISYAVFCLKKKINR